MAGTPKCMMAGAAMVASTMYLAVVGRPMPRTMEASMVSSRVRAKLSAEMVRMALASFRPRPVRVTTPMTKPVQAQAAATPRARRPPFSMACRTPLRDRKLVWARALITFSLL